MIRQIKYSTTVRDRERQIYTYIHMYIERGSNVIPDGVGLLNSLLFALKWVQNSKQFSKAFLFRCDHWVVSQIPPKSHTSLCWGVLTNTKRSKTFNSSSMFGGSFRQRGVWTFSNSFGNSFPQKKHPNQLQCLPLNALLRLCVSCQTICLRFHVVGRRRR